MKYKNFSFFFSNKFQIEKKKYLRFLNDKINDY